MLFSENQNTALEEFRHSPIAKGWKLSGAKDLSDQTIRVSLFRPSIQANVPEEAQSILMYPFTPTSMKPETLPEVTFQARIPEYYFVNGSGTVISYHVSKEGQTVSLDHKYSYGKPLGFGAGDLINTSNSVGVFFTENEETVLNLFVGLIHGVYLKVVL